MTMKQKAHTALVSVVLASTFLLLAATLLHGTDFEASEAGLDNPQHKVDLDVDANYDNEISISAPDDPIEEDHGGIVVVGERDDIKIRETSPDTSILVKLEWESNKIKVFDAGTEVTSPYICNPPKTLSVRGEIASGEPNDVSMTLTSIPPGGVDAITYTVVPKVDINSGLDETQEENPGLYVNANWDDDDSDGWTPNQNPPGAVYAGDKSDAEITGGDNDLRSFSLSIAPAAPVVSGNVKLTFPAKIKVWETDTKKDGGASSEITTGTDIPVADLPKTLYIEGVSGSATFQDIDLKAEHTNSGSSDTLKVTVFEVTSAGLFDGAQQADCSVKHSTPKGSSDRNGKISWDDANGDGTVGDNDPNCEYFHNCMEHQGTVKPSGVTTEVEFDFKREKWRKFWGRPPGGSWLFIDDDGGWVNDDTIDDDEDKSPSSINHIYQIDGPGFGNKTIGSADSYLWAGNLREWVRVKIDGTWYQCSDYLKWHSQVRTKPKNGTEMTRDAAAQQKLGSGWYTLPSSP